MFISPYSNGHTSTSKLKSHKYLMPAYCYGIWNQFNDIHTNLILSASVLPVLVASLTCCNTSSQSHVNLINTIGGQTIQSSAKDICVAIQLCTHVRGRWWRERGEKELQKCKHSYQWWIFRITDHRCNQDNKRIDFNFEKVNDLKKERNNTFVSCVEWYMWYIRGRADKCLAYKRKMKILAKLRFFFFINVVSSDAPTTLTRMRHMFSVVL